MSTDNIAIVSKNSDEQKFGNDRNTWRSREKGKSSLLNCLLIINKLLQSLKVIFVKVIVEAIMTRVTLNVNSYSHHEKMRKRENWMSAID